MGVLVYLESNQVCKRCVYVFGVRAWLSLNLCVTKISSMEQNVEGEIECRLPGVQNGLACRF